jgi:hypothetical protein
MKTDDWVGLLATGTGPSDPHAVSRRYATAIGLGAIGSTVLMLSTLGLRPDLAQAVHVPMFWVKLGFAASMACASLLATLRVSRPGRQLAGARIALAVPVLVMWAIAGVALARADPDERIRLIFGSTWAVCPVLIAMLSIPAYVAIRWAMREMAPTRLSLAGMAAGMLAGAIGALVYCLHCPELAAPFVGIWYLLGILIPTLAGALFGRSMLRW